MKVTIKNLGEVQGSKRFFSELAILFYYESERLSEKGLDGSAAMADLYFLAVHDALIEARLKGESD